MFARGLMVGLALSLAAVGQGSAADLAADGYKRPLAPVEAAPAKPVSFFLFSDTQVSYRYSFPAAEPGVPNNNTANPLDGRDIPKHILNISHADAWEYGTNFFSLDILKSGSQDPAGTANGPGGQAVVYDFGATEAYGLYRGSLSLNKLIGTTSFTYPGFVKDVSLSFGFDANTKNTVFGPEKRDVVGGLVFSVDVPVGFLNVAVHGYKEWNRNGFAVGPFRSVEFDWVPEFEIVYSFPLDGLFGGFPLKLAGFNNIVLPKGNGGIPGTAPTNVEFLSRTNLVLDVGKLVWDQPGRLDAFVGFQYWRNKFGVDKDIGFAQGGAGPGAEEKSFLAGVAVHIF
ncbi:hypothetical protein [Methylorubrum suomiense]|uniref:Uncharacterized protein n=1 Tax=Methylorubrum suomiense TaxID=144191 RepID=A0ABQ4UZT7_9HYPH|nr:MULTISPECIES: hypothetical protein [Methylobacteriaceae]GJE77846.1 hypothetical protein BGCPKDLD_4453 [Methylorubrum suomiense]